MKLGFVFGNSDDPFKDISLNGKKLCKTPITDDIDIDQTIFGPEEYKRNILINYNSY
jgi:hypothetical protein